MKEYKIGDIVKCCVTGIENYGVFVKVDNNYSGLVHISEITYNYVKNIDDYVKIGDLIFCEIIEINKDFKMKLSIKDIDYRGTGHFKKIIESEHGFNPLKAMLPKWTKEKLDELCK